MGLNGVPPPPTPRGSGVVGPAFRTDSTWHLIWIQAGIYLNSASGFRVGVNSLVYFDLRG